MPREKRHPKDKERIQSSYLSDEDYISKANELGIKESTARSIVRRKNLNLHSGKHGGHKKNIINEEIGLILLDYVEQNPLASLEMMREYLISVSSVSPSTATIMRFLEGKCITLKQVRNVPGNRNSPDVIQKRFEFSKWILEAEAVQDCIYIDEFGCNIWTRRSYGRSQMGKRCYRVCHGQRGKNVSV